MKAFSSKHLFLSLCHIFILSYFFIPAVTVKHGQFKTCEQSGFCRRNRAFADSTVASDSRSAYNLDPDSLSFNDGQLTGILLKTIPASEQHVRFPLTVTFLESGTTRVTLDEERRLKGDIVLRHGSQARKERYNEASEWTIVGGLEISKDAVISSETRSDITKILYGPSGIFEASIHHSPFMIEFKRDGYTHVVFNDRAFLNMEHWRPKKEKGKGGEEERPDNALDMSTWWEEEFDGKTDSKPRGPESVGLDISFPGYGHVYGIPEHASSMSLKQTRGGDGNYDEPYRLMNADVFEYEIDSPMTLYGAIPFMQAHKTNSTVGVFWLNGAETWIDIVKVKAMPNPLSLGIASETTTQTHWFSESGLFDVFVFLGPTSKNVAKAYGELTGHSQLPPYFSIAYHQCRWNYMTKDEVLEVNAKFDDFDIPYDVIWLDIEYTDEKKYFTWDPHTFPNPVEMMNVLDEQRRKLVAIIDPHIKNTNNYPVGEELKSQELAVKNKQGKMYEGWCWPGSSYWVDCFNPLAITWWKSLFKYSRFLSAPNMFIWNDMNEPSVFGEPEITMPKDNLHHGNWEHRDVHNINGMTFHNATYEALLRRTSDDATPLVRPFVLTRSFFAGSQRLGAMWTGDNQAAWPHLAASIPMILNNGISGYPFAGADVGGFFGFPSKELLTRWYQAGAFYPFFRGHAHTDSRHREPYLAGSPYTEIITSAIRLRYQLLPVWYTAFREANIDGVPIVRPNWYVHPEDEVGFAIDDQMYIGGSGLLVKPVVEEGMTSVEIYLGDEERYFDYFDYKVYQGKGKHMISAPLEKIPVLMRGGHIFARRERPRRSSGLMRWDPFTIIVVLGKDGRAKGNLYLDDGESFDYEDGAFVHRQFSFDLSTMALTSVHVNGEERHERGKLTNRYADQIAGVRVERIVVVGAPAQWKEKKTVWVVEEGMKESARKKAVPLQWHNGVGGKADWVIVRNPRVRIAKNWKIDFAT